MNPNPKTASKLISAFAGLFTLHKTFNLTLGGSISMFTLGLTTGSFVRHECGFDVLEFFGIFDKNDSGSKVVNLFEKIQKKE